MKYNVTRELLLQTKQIIDAFDLLVGSDHELRKHLDRLLIEVWNDGYDTGYSQGMMDDSIRRQ